MLFYGRYARNDTICIFLGVIALDVVTFLIASGMVNFLADRLKKMVMKRGEKFVEGQAEERVVKPVVNAISMRIFGRPAFKPKLKLEDVLSILQRCLKEQKEIILEERDIALLIRESLDAACAEISAVSRSVEGLQNLIVSESMGLRRWLSGELNALVLRLCEELRSEIQGYSSEDVASVFERIDDSFSRLLSLLTRLSREHGEISRKIDDGFSRLSREHGVIEEKLEDVLEAVVRRPVGVRLRYEDVRGDSSSFVIRGLAVIGRCKDSWDLEARIGDEVHPLNLVDSSVSRKHLRIGVWGGLAVVEDLESKNGTYINGRRIEPHSPVELKDGDEIQIGFTKFKVNLVWS